MSRLHFLTFSILLVLKTGCSEKKEHSTQKEKPVEVKPAKVVKIKQKDLKPSIKATKTNVNPGMTPAQKPENVSKKPENKIEKPTSIEIKNDPVHVSIKFVSSDKKDHNLKPGILHEKISKLFEELKKSDVKDYDPATIFNKFIPGSDKSLSFPTEIKKVHFLIFKKEFTYGFIIGFNDIVNERCKDTETLEVFVRQLRSGKPYLSARSIENDRFSLMTAAKRTMTIQDVKGAGKVFNLEFGLSSADMSKNGVPSDKSCDVAGDVTYEYMRTWVFNSGILIAEKQITTRVETREPGLVDSEERSWKWWTIGDKAWLVTSLTKQNGNVGTGMDDSGNYDNSRDVKTSKSLGAISPQKNGAWKMASRKDIAELKKSSPEFARYYGP